jgi:seryl-tRNA synthetase
MFDIELLRKQKEKVAELLARRGVSPEEVEALYRIDRAWRKLKHEVESRQQEKNSWGKKIAAAAPAERKEMILQVRKLSRELKEQQKKLKELGRRREERWQNLPNLPLPDVPAGGAEKNAVQDSWRPRKARPRFSFAPLSHVDLGLRLGLFDLERARRSAGARFVYYTGRGAELVWALADFALSRAREQGFQLIYPPYLLRPAAMAGSGALAAHGKHEIYRLADDPLYLIATAEQALAAFHMQETLPVEKLPLRYAAFSSCFRREAGAAGREYGGILRLHQFEKIELFVFCRAGEDEQEQRQLVDFACRLLDELRLHYRVVLLAAGDMAHAAARTYDIETWFPARGEYLETHSLSTVTDYQARRLRITMREGKRRSYLYMLNGTALAISRIIAAVLEQHQTARGTVKLPPPLRKRLRCRQLSPP